MSGLYSSLLMPLITIIFIWMPVRCKAAGSSHMLTEGRWRTKINWKNKNFTWHATGGNPGEQKKNYSLVHKAFWCPWKIF